MLNLSLPKTFDSKDLGVSGTSANLADGSYTNAVWTTNSDPFSPNTITITMTVTPLNDAPNVNATGNIDLGTMLEGTAVSPVVQLTDLLRNCHDVDAEWDNTVINLGTFQWKHYLLFLDSGGIQLHYS